MEQIEIQGGAPLAGTIRISGAKNSCLKLMVAALLAEGKTRLQRVPALQDVTVLREILVGLGARVEDSGPQELTIDVPAEPESAVSYDLVTRMRASVLLLAPLLARTGRSMVALPGGCAIGSRPIDQHLKALRLLGAEVAIEHGNVVARCSGLTGARIRFDIVTMGGTETAMMAAALARGTTVLENAAREPEIIDLADLLTAMGAPVLGAGTERVEIQGCERLRPVTHPVIPDRIEAGTYAIAAAITGSELTLEGARPDHLGSLLEILRRAGAESREAPEGLVVTGPEQPLPVNVKTGPYPGFPTDLQAQFMALMCRAEGSSTLVETIFENRFMHVAELARMGARIQVEGRTAVVTGVDSLQGAPVQATDIRASAALVLAGLAAQGTTRVSRLHHVDRGYANIVGKLKGVGARIRRI